MRILILGIDGYLGWSLACTLSSDGHHIYGVDNGSRRTLVKSVGGSSAVPIDNIWNRMNALAQTGHGIAGYQPLDIESDYEGLMNLLQSLKPEVIYHLAQMPSAPYSMKDRRACLWTHRNNMFGTLNLLYAMREAKNSPHLIKIGTMGEYGTPNLPIPEGHVEIEVDGHKDFLPFPRAAWSWYHQTKVHDTHNIRMACKIWGLRCTDVMQGIVYGSRVEGMNGSKELNTRLDFDQYFGTAINRFIVQAVIGHPLTIYGRGTQVRSILPLQDSMNCLNLIALNPPAPGVYRELNQFHEYMSVASMAEIVADAHEELTGTRPEINHYENPRREKEEHFYRPVRGVLEKMGYRPSQNIKKVVRCMILEVLGNKEALEEYSPAIVPTTHWSGDTRAIQTLSN